MTDDIATMMNMMMANNFTAASYHITDAANAEKAVSSLKETTINNQWMCGMPEKLIIVTVGEDYVVSAFGNGQVIDAFKTTIKKDFSFAGTPLEGIDMSKRIIFMTAHRRENLGAPLENIFVTEKALPIISEMDIKCRITLVSDEVYEKISFG